MLWYSTRGGACSGDIDGGYQVKENIHKIFEDWNETIVWSCLQGIMGEIHTNLSEDAAMAILGDFAFFAGNPSEELIRFKPESSKRDFIIMVPRNAMWADLIEKCYKDKAEKVIRYAIKKEADIFDVEKLKQAAASLPDGYELKVIQEAEYNMCQENGWANDLVSQYKDYKYLQRVRLGCGYFKGLAYVSGAKLILECLKRDLYPSWDAQNKCSAALAEKLGYHFSHEYAAYEVTGY